MNWKQTNVLITGGTGTFGKNFVRILLKEFEPKRLIVFSRDELKQHEMRINGYDHKSLRYFIGDVRDVDRLRRAMYGVDVVVHAAAMKQVPACEYNPMEAIMTNVMGVKNVIDAALDNGVGKVLGISSDKAVNPTNLYGATKLAGEKLFIHGNAYAGARDTVMSCVRYGNVLGSRGSVIPVFMQQRETGVLSITDERMTRFWLTIEQGVHFSLRCIERMKGGEVFVPKIPSMGIGEIAEAIAPGCKTKNIGIRSGEKLHEVLISEHEAQYTYDVDNTTYTIRPPQTWVHRESNNGGKLVKKDFVYTSDTNPDWLTKERLLELVVGTV